MAENNQIQLAATPKNLSQFLSSDGMKAKLAEGITKHFTPERLARMAVIAVTRQPFLLQCSMESFAFALSSAGQLGLECDGMLGRAYLVPFKNNKLGIYEAQFMIGYRGMLDLMRRSGDVHSFNCYLVYEADKFEVIYGTNPSIMHVPTLDGERGSWKFVYSVAQLKGEGISTHVMNRAQINAIRDKSQSYKTYLKDMKDAQKSKWATCIWIDNEEEMVKKTCIRQHFKYLPATIDNQDDYERLGRAFEIDNRDYEVEAEPPEPDGQKHKIGFHGKPESTDKQTGEVKQDANLELIVKINATKTEDELNAITSKLDQTQFEAATAVINAQLQRLSGKIQAPTDKTLV